MEGSQGTTPALCASLRPCHAVSAAAQLASGQPPLTPPPSTLLTTFQHSARLFQAAIQCSERLWSMVRGGILRTATVSSESVLMLVGRWIPRSWHRPGSLCAYGRTHTRVGTRSNPLATAAHSAASSNSRHLMHGSKVM